MRMQTFLIRIRIRREIMNKKRAAWLVAALMTANGISGGGTGSGQSAR
mgnify:FL=1